MVTATSRRAQFEFELQHRQRILNSSLEERTSVTEAVYTELFEKFPDHSVFLVTEEDRRRKGVRGAMMIGPLTNSGDRVLEIGCGRGDVLVELAKRGRRCVGVEPSHQMIRMCEEEEHDNVAIMLGTAERLDIADESFDAVFSEQVLEHMHPNDVPRHLAEAFRVLRPGGVLAVETPNRRTGPQDISRGFVRVAQGLHLKEWTYAELNRAFRDAGFVRVRGLLVPPYLIRRLPMLHRLAWVPAIVKCIEDLVLILIPALEVRTLVARALGLNDIFLFGRKPG